jgi:hypothetical protein
MRVVTAAKTTTAQAPFHSASYRSLSIHWSRLRKPPRSCRDPNPYMQCIHAPRVTTNLPANSTVSAQIAMVRR